MSKVVFEETAGGNEWKLHEDGTVRESGLCVLASDGTRVHGFREPLYLFAESWRAEHWPRFAPLGKDETMLDGERVKFTRAAVRGDGTPEIFGPLLHIEPFSSFEHDYWHPDTAEKAQAWWLANWQRPADEWFDRKTKRVRKLRDDEGVRDDGRLVTFRWDGTEAKAIHGDDSVVVSFPRSHFPLASLDALASRLESWARANLPAHLAIVDGRVVEMADDQARDTSGQVRKCSYWSPNLDAYILWAPGQKERVEKWWRASQEKERSYPNQKKYSWTDVEITIIGRALGNTENVTIDCELNKTPKPLGENELERLNGTRELITGAVRLSDDDVPALMDVGCSDAYHPWANYTELRKAFVPGSIDRAKRIFARLYKFRDDEGVDPETGKLRTMAINEARHPETGEIVRLSKFLNRFGNECYGTKYVAVHRNEVLSSSSPFLARCIAYRDHVLKMEKELEELKGGAK